MLLPELMQNDTKKVWGTGDIFISQIYLFYLLDALLVYLLYNQWYKGAFWDMYQITL